MSAVQNFFLVCSGASKSILKRTPIEINRYVGIGATIFFTGFFAFLAASYALYSVFHSVFFSMLFGLFWGLMIFNLDRFIVSTMRKKGKFFRDMATVFPRIMLALLIAVVIAKPLELKIFESEINAEIALMQQENKIEQEALVKSRFQPDIDNWNTEIANLKSEINSKTESRDLLVQNALAEADGSGGSQRRNMGPIYAVKRAEAERVESELNSLVNDNHKLIQSREAMIQERQTELKQALFSLEDAKFNGFAAKIEAMNRLSSKSNAIYYAGLFIMLLFIAIELAPILVKLISERSPYDFVLDKHEFKYEMNHKYINDTLQSETLNNLNFDIDTGRYKTQLAIDAEKEISKKALKDHLESIKSEPLVWKDLLKKGKLFQLD